MKTSQFSALVAAALCCLSMPSYSQQTNPEDWDYVAEPNRERASVSFGFNNPLALPSVGSAYMRILRPDLLELVRITPDTATWNFVSNLPEPEDFEIKINGTVQNAVQEDGIGFKRRPLYAPLAQYDLRIENSLYLKLEDPLAENDLVEVSNSSGGANWPANLRFIGVNHSDRYSPVIHVNQEGYLSGSQFPRRAIIGYFLGNLTETSGFPGEMDIEASLAFHLVNVKTKQVAYSGTLGSSFLTDTGWPQGQAQYQRVRVADFTSFSTPGEYFLRVSGLGASFPFRIGDDVAMALTRSYALGLYHQRCGAENAFPYTRHVHGPCHLFCDTQPPTACPRQSAFIPNTGQNYPNADSITHVNRILFANCGTFSLRLMRINSLSEVPSQQWNFADRPTLQIIIARYDTEELHFRIFDQWRNVVQDVDENYQVPPLQGKSGDVKDLKSILNNFWNAADLNEAVNDMHGDTRRAIIEAVLSILEHGENGRVNNDSDGYEHTARRLQTIEASLYPIQNSGVVDVSLGHHDAGDYSKYTINSAHLIHTLVFAADNFSGAFDNLGIPESGNSKSDLLELAKWEADFLLKMQDSDGGFYFLVYPKERPYETDVLPAPGDSQVLFPKNTAATAAAVAALAEIGSSPTFKAQFGLNELQAENPYMDAATAGWNFLMTHLGSTSTSREAAYQRVTHYGDQFGHNDELAWAAAALFAATGSSAYFDALEDWHPDPNAQSARRWTWWRMFEGYGAAARTIAFAIPSGRRAASDFSAPNRSTYLGKCQTEITTWGTDVRNWSKFTAYGTSLSVHHKANFDAGFHFSSDWAFDVAVADRLQGHADNINAIIANLNYELGCNPVNVTYVTGLGSKRQREIVHQYAQNDIRILPPSGIPLGNVIEGFPWNGVYQSVVGQACFPALGPGATSFGLFDRWADAYNVSQEFVHVQSARALATAAYIAGLSSTGQPWTYATATIEFPNAPPGPGSAKLPQGSLTVAQLDSTIDLTEARVVWEVQGQEPQFGSRFFPFVPTSVGEFWIEAEACLPDGRRVFAKATFLVNDPNGGTQFDPDANTIALYRFNDSFDDEIGPTTWSFPYYHLTKYGGVELAENTTWMKNPSGKVARFSALGDYLQITTIADDYVLPEPPPTNPPTPNPALTIEFRIYPRAYPAPDNVIGKIFEFRQQSGSQCSSLADNAKWELTDFGWPPGPWLRGPSDVPALYHDDWNTHVTLNQWSLIKITLNSSGVTTFYINGSQVAQGSSSPPNYSGTCDWALTIGNFVGDVDEVRISNVVRD